MIRSKNIFKQVNKYFKITVAVLFFDYIVKNLLSKLINFCSILILEYL
jgi:hypothetical protein